MILAHNLVGEETVMEISAEVAEMRVRWEMHSERGDNQVELLNN